MSTSIRITVAPASPCQLRPAVKPGARRPAGSDRAASAWKLDGARTTRTAHATDQHVIGAGRILTASDATLTRDVKPGPAEVARLRYTLVPLHSKSHGHLPRGSHSPTESENLIPETGSEEAPEEDRLWRFAQRSGISRRRFLHLASVGGAAAVLAACTGLSLPDSAESAPARSDAPRPTEPWSWFKDTTSLIRHDDGSLEARLEDMQGTITPSHLFFVRNNSTSMDIGVATWRLSVEGDAVAGPIELSYDDLRSLPGRTLVSYLECAGNHRSMFNLVNGQETMGTQWGTGGIGNGEWTGVSLRDVLTLAGITGDAISVLLIGLDADSPEEGFRRALPVDKAMHRDTLLAYALNGEALPKDHGFPLRAVVPGWVGSSWTKWLGRILVSSERLWTRNNTTSYVLVGDDYPPEGQAEGKVVTTQVIKSALALPWPAELPAGQRRIHGYAHSPDGPISRVEWRTDSGAGWIGADVWEPQVQYSWARFELTWDATPGDYTLMTRATDVAGNTQPDTVPFNEKGYLFNQPLPHPIRVT